MIVRQEAAIGEQAIQPVRFRTLHKVAPQRGKRVSKSSTSEAGCEE